MGKWETRNVFKDRADTQKREDRAQRINLSLLFVLLNKF